MNCYWIDRCKTYHAVEKQHGAEHLTSSPDFQGNNPSIHVIVKDVHSGSSIEWDVRACKSFQEDKGKWQRLRPGQKLPS